MTAFVLVLAILSPDPSRLTRSQVVERDLTLARCATLAAAAWWAHPDRHAVEYRCEPALQVAEARS
jgi:hypothetical protein